MSLLLAAAGATKPAATIPTPFSAPIQNAPVPASQMPLVTTPESWAAIHHLGWLSHTLAALAIVLAIGLVLLLAIQTTKQEGLSGTIGGRVESAYRGRLGMEENLKRLTGFVATSLVVVWAILSLTGI